MEAQALSRLFLLSDSLRTAISIMGDRQGARLARFHVSTLTSQSKCCSRSRSPSSLKFCSDVEGIGGILAPMVQQTKYNDSFLHVAFMSPFERKVEDQLGGPRHRRFLPTLRAQSVIASESSSEDLAELTAERRQLFSTIAPMYDQLNDWLSLGQHRIWKRMAVQWSRAAPGDSVLDVCCGSGDLTFLLAEKVGVTGKVVGLDFSPNQLEVAARRQSESFSASSVDMRWVQGDALALPFGDEEFDAVTIGYGLRNVGSIPTGLREVWRVLKPGKSAAILDFNNSTDPLIKGVQAFALKNLVVPLATQFGMAAEYEYLQPSIDRFPIGSALERHAREAGFSPEATRYYEIAGGLMGVLVAYKSEL
eukprot:TRINITY_DN13161_c0_g1_i1.p1 TRINITY_DN13161_c0_g1~~TRINITY_DN13161_c0_g1_i1.p1  ORF type:complete len:364 (-),score=40.70 TRINITY_DN13161_c0_g1_i1:402-1493(-)